jgi:hypothetical protein
MHFTGVSLVGVPLLAEPKTTAVGGTQTIGLWKELATGEIVPLDLPFAASTDNGDALSVITGGPNEVVIDGTGSGSDYLRITEADSDLLYDRYTVDADALDHIELVPATYETYDEATPVSFYAGDVKFGLALYSATDERLADDSMTLTFTGPQPTRSDWDTFELGAVAPGTLTGQLTAAGMPGPIDLQVVDTVDAVDTLSNSFPATITPGTQGDVCFTASAGQSHSVLGLPWAFTSTGAVTSVISINANCFAVQVNAPGDFTVTATVLGMSKARTFTAVAAAAGAKPTAPAPGPVYADGVGERARLLHP